MTLPARRRVIPEPLPARVLSWLARRFPVDYDAYLRSAAWRRRADRAKRRAGWRCQLCNTPAWESVLDAHHRTYDRLGLELPDDLIVLCRRCHRRHHGRQN